MEKIKTHILCSINIVFIENHVVYGIMWKNIVELDRTQITVWSMRFACWIPKVTNTHSEYVIFVAFPLQQWLRKRAPTLSYTYIAWLILVIGFIQPTVGEGRDLFHMQCLPQHSADHPIKPQEKKKKVANINRAV